MSEHEPDYKNPEAEPHHYPEPPADEPADEPADKPIPRLTGRAEQDKLPEGDEPRLEQMSEDVRENRVMAAICYLGILFLVPLLVKDRSDYALFHCRQGIILFAFQSLLSFVVWIPVVGPILLVLLMAISLVAAVMAWQGKEWKLPLLHRYAAMLKL
jgi:uncharacterized membrane protein